MRYSRRSVIGAALLAAVFLPVEAHSVACDRVIGVDAPAGGARLVKHFDLGPPTVVTDVEFISNDVSTVFPRVELLEGTAAGMAAGVVRAEFVSVNPAGRHRVHLDCGPLTLAGDVCVAITLPAGAAAQAIGQGPGIGAMQLAASDGHNFIASAADGRFEAIDVNLAIFLNAGVIGKARGPAPDESPPPGVAPSLRISSLGASTQVVFTSPTTTRVRITAYDVSGRVVRLEGRFFFDSTGLHSAGRGKPLHHRPLRRVHAGPGRRVARDMTAVLAIWLYFRR